MFASITYRLKEATKNVPTLMARQFRGGGEGGGKGRVIKERELVLKTK